MQRGDNLGTERTNLEFAALLLSPRDLMSYRHVPIA